VFTNATFILLFTGWSISNITINQLLQLMGLKMKIVVTAVAVAKNIKLVFNPCSYGFMKHV